MCREISVREISAQIETLEQELSQLYHARAGRKEVLSDGMTVYWCAGCGRNTVNAEDGFDTCGECDDF
jgi:hypothetical protein